MENGAMKIKLLVISVIVTAVLIIGYETFRLISVTKEKSELKTRFAELVEQRASSELDLSKKDIELNDALRKLKPLEDELLRTQNLLEEKTVQEMKLRKQVTRVQTDLEDLGEKIAKYKDKFSDLNDALKASRKDKAAAEKASAKLSNDVASLIKKYNRSIEVIRSLKDQSIQIRNSNVPLRKKAMDLMKTVSAKEADVAKLEQEKAALQAELENMKVLKEQALAEFNAQMDDLKAKIPQKDSQITDLSASRDALTKQLQEADTKLNVMTAANSVLEKQVEELNSSRKSLESDFNKIKSQAADQDSVNASLKMNLEVLRKALDDKEKERSVLADQLDKVGSQGKNMQQDLLSVKASLASKEQELKQKILDMESANTLYNNLKLQLPQISNLLTQKELELDGSLREAAALKEELALRNQEKEMMQAQIQDMEGNISSLQSKYQDIRTELNLARQQQKKMVDTLNKAASLNSTLQQSLVGLSQAVSQDEEEQERARELKSKVEVILTPQENKE